MLRKKRIEPGPDQESVWDYPRPPALELDNKTYKIVLDGHVVAESSRVYRVLETSHPPTIYFPPEDVDASVLVSTHYQTFCEFKGAASYWNVQVGDRLVKHAGWFYPTPNQRFASLVNYISFYPSKMDECTVDGEVVQSQEGDFYGGWITSAVVGPFKGAPGTWGW